MVVRIEYSFPIGTAPLVKVNLRGRIPTDVAFGDGELWVTEATSRPRVHRPPLRMWCAMCAWFIIDGQSIDCEP